MKTLGIEGAWVLEPRLFEDSRGSFHEWFRGAEFRAATGHDLPLAQANCTTSRRGTIRGIHFTDVPPGQAKYVSCVRGVVLDVLVDIRVGSPTFGRWEVVQLDDVTHRAVYLPPGLGHAYTAVTDNAIMSYLCSSVYRPERERAIHPLDPELSITWPAELDPIISDRDQVAPTLAEARELGILPTYEDCQKIYENWVTDQDAQPVP